VSLARPAWIMRTDRRTKTLGVLGALVLGLLAVPRPVMAEPALVPPDLREQAITIDATQVHPPTWWYVPGITPIIWSLDPSSTEAFRTTEPHQLALKPGAYQFGTFTFDFPFVVTPEGVLDFARSLDECVGGRGTHTLTVRCSQTQPFVRQPEYNVGGK
jgi:hypothetical protein